MSRIASSRIDLGLALLLALRKPGETFTQRDIAAWCGCTKRWIGIIEERALKKLRRVVRRGDSSLSEELSETAPARMATSTRAPKPQRDCGEISFKRWVIDEAARIGISPGAVYQRMHRHPETRPAVRRVNGRVLLVQKAA